MVLDAFHSILRARCPLRFDASILTSSAESRIIPARKTEFLSSHAIRFAVIEGLTNWSPWNSIRQYGNSGHLMNNSDWSCGMNSKSRFFGIVLIMSAALFLQSCGVPMTKGDNWLASKTDKPEMDVSGSWSSPEWGVAKLKQEDKYITGMLGDYPVRGVASGNGLYLMMYSGDRVHYFAELKAADKNTLKGLYSAKFEPINEAKNAPVLTRPMSLTKVVPQ